MLTGYEMALPASSLRNLEILQSAEDGGVRGSLLWVVDRTRTPFGRRLLRRWLTRPLLKLAFVNSHPAILLGFKVLISLIPNCVSEITARQDAIQVVMEGQCSLLPKITELITGLPDLERVASNLLYQKVCHRSHAAAATAYGLRERDSVTKSTSFRKSK